MEFMVVVILYFLSCICNGNVFGPSTQSSVNAENKETRCIQSAINVLKDDIHELLKRVIKNENDISSLQCENQFLTNKIVNERRQFSCDIKVLHENTNEHQQLLNDTNTEINHLNETIEKLRKEVDKLEELQGRMSGENITECIDKSVTPCHSSPCSNGGNCTPAGSSFACSCRPGYFGNQCQGTPCNSSPCVNGGICKPTGSSFVCSCPTEYSGKQCQITPCHSSPCLNGGRCTPTNSGFLCSCQTGFSGNRCQIRPSCPYGWKMNDKKCYYFSSESRNWYNAKYYCQRRSSMLAEVTTRSKMTFLRTNAQVNRETFWLGGSDQADEGVWIWTTSGYSFTVTDWHTRTRHEPNNQNGDEHCLNIFKQQDYEWNDETCSRSFRFICEKPLV